MSLPDLAERKQTEELYMSVVELAPDPIAIVDTKGVITWCNASAATAAGYSRDEIIGRHFSKLGFLRARDIPVYLKVFSSTLRGEAPKPFEVNWRSKDGTPRCGELHVGLIKEEGQTTRVLVITRDITERKRTEEALRESEERYRSVIENSLEGIVIVDDAYRLTYVNNELCRILEYSREEIIGQDFRTFLDDESKQLLTDRYVRRQRGEKVPPPYEFNIVRKDGEKRRVEISSAVINDPAAKVRTVAQILDITERKRAEEALRESEEKFKAQYKGIPVPTYTWQRVGEDFVLVDYNDAAEAITHGSVVDFVGRTASGMYRDRPDILEELSRCFTEKTTIKREMEYRFTAIGESKDLAVSYVFVPPDLVMVHTEDITERKRAEREIEERQLYLEGLLTAAPDAIVTLDSRHRIVEWNSGAERLFGYSQEEVIGRSLDHLVTNPDTYEEAVGFTQIVMSGKDLPPVETVRYRKDGSPVDVIAAGSPILVEDELVGVVAVYTDITQRKQAEEEIQRSSEQLAVLNTIGMAVSGTLDLEEVLQIIQRRAMELLGEKYPPFFALFNEEDQTFEVALTHVQEEMAGRMDKLIGRRLGGFSLSFSALDSALREAVLAGKPYVTDDSSVHSLPGISRKLIKAAQRAMGINWGVVIPLWAKGKLVGISLLFSQKQEILEEDMELLSGVANQAAVAIQNARLYEQEQERRQEAETLRQAAQALSATLDLQEVFESILSELQRMVPYDSASVQLLKGDHLEIIGGHGFPNLDELLGISFPVEGDNPNRQVVATRAPFIVEDAPAVYSTFREEPHAQAGIRAWLGVPLLFGDRLIGMIALDKRVPGFYTEEHARLALAFAAQAAIAIENARLYQEAQKRLAETTVLHRVAEVINSTLELKEVFQRVVEEISETFGYRLVDIYLLEESGLRLQANVGYDEKTTIELIPLERGVVGRVARTGQPAFIRDVSQDPDYIGSYPDITGEICVPVKSGETLLGTLNVECDEKKPLTDDDLKLLSTLSSHIGAAIENALLYEEEQRLSTQRKTIAEVGRTAAAILDMDTLLSRVVHLIAQGFRYYRVHIFQVDQGSGYAVYRAGTGEAALTIAEKGLRLKIGEEGLVGWVALHGQPLLVNDVSKDPRYYSHPELPDTRSELDVPIRIGEKIIGVLDVQSTELNAFDESDLATLQTLADQLAVAMENARLYQETKRLAITDSLTGLYNLRYFYEALEREIQRSERYHRSVSLIILDIDDFKAYNDRYGHLAGDDLLIELAQLMSEVTRRTDTVARYGGEEFAIILPETETEGARVLAERLLEKVREHRFSTEDGQTIGRITISLGAATYPHHADSAKALVGAADKALLRAKRAGKNRLFALGEKLIELKPR